MFHITNVVEQHKDTNVVSHSDIQSTFCLMPTIEYCVPWSVLKTKLTVLQAKLDGNLQLVFAIAAKVDAII